MDRGRRKGLRSCGEVREVRIGRDVEVPLAIGPEHADELGGPLYRQWTQKQAVDEREDGAIAADAQCEREDRDQRHGGPPPRNPHGVPEVLKEGRHRWPFQQC